jgi:type I restriction enzyme S subunit
MNKVDEYRPGYKKTKLGWIPEEWQYDFIEKYAIRGSGHTPNKRNKSFYNGGIKWVSLADSKRLDNIFIKETEIEISEEGINNSSAVLHPKGTVLVSRDAGVGKSAIMFEDMAVSQHFIVWQCKEELINLYLYYFLQYQKPLFERMAIGSTIKTIGLSFFKKYKVLLPPLPEQQKIAAILSTWDRAIDLTQQLIAAKEEQKKGLMQRLFQAQDNWKKYTYKQLLKEVKRPIEWDDEEKYDLISVRRRSGGLFHRDSLFGHQIKTKNLRTAREGDFLISKMQIVHGASGLTTKEFDGMKISGSYIALVSRNSNLLDIEYLNWVSKTSWFYHQTYISSYGVHIEKMTFDFKSFLKQPISLPPLENQKDTVQKLNLFAKEIKLLNAKVMILKEQKKGLMQQLLTGKIRVK